MIPAPPEDPGTPGVPGLPSGSQGSGSSGGTAARGHKAQDHSDSGPGVYREAAAPPVSPQELPVPSAATDPLPDYGALEFPEGARDSLEGLPATGVRRKVSPWILLFLASGIGLAACFILWMKRRLVKGRK